ncbi:SDR family oxidoreductase [Georgenia sp. 10Sc9-8]|uniref:SDR family oxidoreductase n=1 Tax=Georgenia halotolerans TaxID=3028317 RepID=A0ABT5U0R5_9MICO|nr:SDR family oxidoreductase [Georgenia halotolerans]
MRVKGSVAVVVGASSGIGRATALRLARKGADVVVAARREEPLRDLAAECESHGVRALAVPTDITEDADARNLLDRTLERFGRVDTWVNTASVTFFGPFHEVPMADFRRVVDVNVMGVALGSRVALEQMREQRRGVLINVSSVVGEVPQPYTSAYSLSKAAVRALGTSLRSELMLDGLTGVKVTTVLPATIDTPFFQHAANYSGRQAVPMPPVYSPERVARAIVNVVRVPRREIVVGPLGRLMAVQHRITPRATEALMAVQVDKTQLSRHQEAPPTDGNLHRPGGEATATGGWHGRRRTAQRAVVGMALLVAAGAGARRLVR